MICPGCGYESADRLETCSRCGTPMAAGTVAAGAVGDLRHLRLEPERSAPGQWLPGRRTRRTMRGTEPDRRGDFVEMLDDDAIEVGEDDLDRALSVAFGAGEDDRSSSFRIDDDLFAGDDPGTRGVPDEPAVPADPGTRRGPCAAPGADLPGPAFEFPEEECRTPAGAEPIIDRDDEVPERYWAPEVAGLGRRAVALLIDQGLLLAALGVFFVGTLLALRINGIDSDVLLAAAGLQASALPFLLLGAGFSLAYYVYFHRTRGCTPGKALLGVEVRTSGGGALSWSRAVVRWLGAALGVACAGAGVCWAVFEPRHRGWADLISGTVVARTQRARKASRLSGAH